jgi:glycosyltransferase involved in cell wall biosynthesis
MKVSVVIPVHNEAATIAELLARVDAVAVSKEIIVVDDGSTDGTRDRLREIAPSMGVRLLLHDRNRGKRAALRTGFAVATGDVVVVQDADLEYDPSEYKLLIDPIAQGKADVVYGSRLCGGQCRRVLYFWHYPGNRVSRWCRTCSPT